MHTESIKQLQDNRAALSKQRDHDVLRRICGETLLACLADPQTIEVMCNADGRIWQERLGEDMEVVGSLSIAEREAIIRFVAGCLNKVITWNTPQLDGEFPLDGSRFSGAIPPVVSAPIFSIRKPASRIITLDEYLTAGVMTSQQHALLCSAVAEHHNIVVVGGTSSGKTTFANAMLAEMVRQFPHERQLLIEDTSELQCAARNVVAFHTTLEVAMRLCLKQALRLRPDRIHVGEVRDEAALDLLDAWNTGHEGGIATVHANSATAGLARLESLISRSPYAPKNPEAIIGEAVQILVFMMRTPAGRRVQEIIEVKGYSKTEGYRLQSFN